MKSYFHYNQFQLKHNMKLFWNKYQYIIITGFGTLLGGIFTYLLLKLFSVNYKDDSQSSEWDIFNQFYQSIIISNSVEFIKIWKSVFVIRIRDFLILFFIGMMKCKNLGIHIFLFIEGAFIGYLIGNSILYHGTNGLIFCISTLFPHYIIYIAAIFLMIKFFHKKEYAFRNTAAIICLVILFIFVGTLVESVLNPIIQKWTLYQISNFIQ